MRFVNLVKCKQNPFENNLALLE